MYAFNPQSLRVRQARLGHRLRSKPLRTALWVVAVGLAGLALGGLVFDRPIWGLGLIVAGPLLMVLEWHSGHLSQLPPIKRRQRPSPAPLHEILAPEIIRQLPDQPNLKQLAEAIADSKGGRFYHFRFAINYSQIAQYVAPEPVPDSLWQQADQLAEQYGEAGISSVALAASFITAHSGGNDFLAQLELDPQDVTAGLGWYHHQQKVLAQFEAQKSLGGIGRNLTFGYTPLLNKIGFNVSRALMAGNLLHRPLEGHTQAIQQMIQQFASAGRQNVALVGKTGVGKTTLVYAFARELIKQNKAPNNLAHHQVVALDASTLISHGRKHRDFEGLIRAIFNEAVTAKNVILFFDDAQTFLQQATGAVDLSQVLLPILEGSKVRIITALTEQDWLQINQESPGLAQQMNRISVQPLGREDTLKVMEDQVLLLEGQYQVTYLYQALKEAYRLADRYIQEQAFPGKAVKLLESAAGHSQDGFVFARSVQQAVEQNFNVKVQTAKTSGERQNLLQLEEKIHQNMVNQDRAVKVVANALRRSRAGVGNQNRPIGTFLFLGPTGVGKTQLSKSLSGSYFGGDEEIVRVDMNEYSNNEDSQRLLATAAENSQSLAAQIKKQPFSVVLLDEIEKAHPNVTNLLLQMLDEGILRDSQNQEVSFRDAIIIATSNAGANQIRAHIENGESLEDFEQEFIDQLIDQQTFRPEFINRFDEVVLFRPLTQAELIKIVDLITAEINQRLNQNQKITIELTQEAKEWLAQEGYDPRLGARPLRRTMQRTVENIVAQKVLAQKVQAGATLELDVNDLSQTQES